MLSSAGYYKQMENVMNTNIDEEITVSHQNVHSNRPAKPLRSIKERYEAIQAAIDKDPMMKRLMDRQTVGKNMWRLLDQIEHDHNISKARVLNAAGHGQPGESTKRLPYYAINPSLPDDVLRERANDLTQNATKYRYIAQKVAELAHLDEQPIVVKLFEGTTFESHASSYMEYVYDMYDKLTIMTNGITKECQLNAYFKTLERVRGVYNSQDNNFTKGVGRYNGYISPIDLDLSNGDFNHIADYPPMPEVSIFRHKTSEKIETQLLIYDETEWVEVGVVDAQMLRHVKILIAPGRGEPRPIFAFHNHLVISNYNPYPRALRNGEIDNKYNNSFITSDKTGIIIGVMNTDGSRFDLATMESNYIITNTKHKPEAGNWAYVRGALRHDALPEIMREIRGYTNMCVEISGYIYPAAINVYNSKNEHIFENESMDSQFNEMYHNLKISPYGPEPFYVHTEPVNPHTINTVFSTVTNINYIVSADMDIPYPDDFGNTQWPPNSIGQMVEANLLYGVDRRVDEMLLEDAYKKVSALQRYVDSLSRDRETAEGRFINRWSDKV